jgi:hypothetical protein
MVEFAVMCVIGSPIILFHLGIAAVRDWIEARWPGSARARAVSFWLGLLAPVALVIVLLIVTALAFVRVRQLEQARRGL